MAASSDKENTYDLVIDLLSDSAATWQLANVLDLLDRVVKSGLNNGLALFDSAKFIRGNDVCLETLTTSYLLKKHELKRILILNLNRDPASRVQRAFYSESK